MAIRPSLQNRLKKIKLFLCDVDGVMTDGAIWMGREGETKRFNIRDGLSLRILQRCGIQVGWVSRRPSAATQERAKDLKIDFLVQSDSGKVASVESILQQTKLNWEDLCFVGDDIVDICVLKRVGLAVVVGDGTEDTKAFAHYITKANGGHGAIRETVELILKAQKKWQQVVTDYAE
ncbi:MAG: HAD hydrolase family protein [Akkermansiaceae bacterium]|nr:HAD hydrolase family protein [Verrucomicrobiales bacterium]